MTNKEAQKMLTEIRHYLTAGNPVWDVDKVGEALTMAIEALKDVQNCVHCEHYTEIETDTGIEGECKMDTAHKVSEIPTGSDLISRRDAIDALQCEWCVEKINNLPSAEPKTGKWTEIENGEYLCSNCLHITIGYPPNNCPNCGSFNGGKEE